MVVRLSGLCVYIVVVDACPLQLGILAVTPSGELLVGRIFREAAILHETGDGGEAVVCFQALLQCLFQSQRVAENLAGRCFADISETVGLDLVLHPLLKLLGEPAV